MDGQGFFQLELFQFYRPEVRPLPADWRPSDIGYSAIGLWVSNLDATLVRLQALGTAPLTSTMGVPEVNTPMVVEERKSLPAAGAKLKEIAGTLEIKPACDYMYARLKKRQYMIIPGFRARPVAAIARWFPNIMRMVSERIVLWVTRST